MAELKYTYALDKNENCIGIGNAQKGIEYRWVYSLQLIRLYKPFIDSNNTNLLSCIPHVLVIPSLRLKL